jgi:phage-related holin
MSTEIKYWGGAVVAAALAWFIQLESIYKLMLVFIALDVGSGVAASLVKKTTDSREAWKGIFGRKVSMLFGVCTFAYIPELLGPTVAAQMTLFGLTLGQGLALYASGIEVMSICENVTRGGFVLPPGALETLAKYLPGARRGTGEVNAENPAAGGSIVEEGK